MDLDELKRGLATLADEMAPFEGDVRVLHRRERRRRVAVSSIAAVIVVAIAVATVAISRNGESGKVHVAGVPSKEVSPDRITHIDAIVVPATPAVKEALDASPLVSQYAWIPAADRSESLLNLVTQPAKSALCRLQTSPGYAVDAVTPGPVFEPGLVQALGASASITVTDQFNADAEIFMKVGAPSAQTESVRRALEADPDVQSFRYITHADAYEIFKIDFANQPALLQSTKPSDLPESFRIIVKPGRSVVRIVDRYKNLDGVDTTITPLIGGLFAPFEATKNAGKHVSPCTNP